MGVWVEGMWRAERVPSVKRSGVHLLEGLGKLADVVGCAAFEESDLHLGYALEAEGAAHVLEQRLAILEVHERPVKGAVESLAAHAAQPPVSLGRQRR